MSGGFSMKIYIIYIILLLANVSCYKFAKYENPTDGPIGLIAQLLGSMGGLIGVTDEGILKVSNFPTSILEGGSATFSLQLASAPNEDTTVEITANSQLVTFNGQSTEKIVFTPANYSTPKEILLVSLKDTNIVNDSVTVNIKSGTLVNRNFPLTITDSESVSIVLSGVTEVAEGSSGQLLVKLSAAPVQSVDVNLASSNTGAISLSSSVLTFTTDNWNTEQVVTLTSLVDNNIDSDSVSITATSSGLPTATKTVISKEIQIRISGLNIIPRNSSSDLDIYLDVNPGRDVEVSLYSSDTSVITINVTSMSFNSSNWSTPQKVTLTALAQGSSAVKSATILASASGLQITSYIVLNQSGIGPGALSYSPNSPYNNGTSISLSPTISGTVTGYSVSPALPTGISLNTSTGVISGTYNSYSGSKGTYTVTATNANGTSSANVTLNFFGKLKPIKTGQTVCYSGTTDTTATCSGTGQDGELQKGRAANFSGPSLVGVSDYTTTDNYTGLVWKSCAEGLGGSTCTGTVTPITWANSETTCTALNAGAGYAGITNWRLPTPDELRTLVDYSTNSTSFFSQFPNTPTVLDGFWSSVTNLSNTANAWAVEYGYGKVWSKAKTSSLYIRCVSGTTLPNSTYVDNGNGTITDLNTSLMWQKCTNGQTGLDCASGSVTAMNWSTALNTCNSLSLGSKSAGQWRLPSIQELATIVSTSTNSPAILTTFFPGTSSATLGYYSSTSYINFPTYAWLIKFGDGTVDATQKTNSSYVRCVADAP